MTRAFSGAGDQIRTGDPHLGKPVVSNHLSASIPRLSRSEAVFRCRSISLFDVVFRSTAGFLLDFRGPLPAARPMVCAARLRVSIHPRAQTRRRLMKPRPWLGGGNLELTHQRLTSEPARDTRVRFLRLPDGLAGDDDRLERLEWHRPRRHFEPDLSRFARD